LPIDYVLLAFCSRLKIPPSVTNVSVTLVMVEELIFFGVIVPLLRSRTVGLQFRAMSRRRLVVSRKFADALERVRWADEQILELKARSLHFFKAQGYGRTFKTDPKTGYRVDKIKLTGPFPSSIVRNVVQIIESLRSALDQGACAVVKGATKKRATSFPFGDTKRKFDSALGDKCKYVPNEIKSVFRKLKPYKRGNPPLWVLNRICNTTKHRATIEPGLHFKDVVFDDTWSVGEPDGVVTSHPIWDARKHEIIVSRATGKGTIHHDVEFSLAVAFGKVPIFQGRPVLPVLRYLASRVESILWLTECEARRVGIVR
jgi:hypothetical protein